MAWAEEEATTCMWELLFRECGTRVERAVRRLREIDYVEADGQEEIKRQAEGDARI
jgi:hypothetical protein